MIFLVGTVIGMVVLLERR